ncbi:MAG: glycosyltransferase [Caldilinea sp.]
MRIAIWASGSRGDVQPYIALGVGLHRAGHGVRLITNENYQSLVTSFGLECWPIKGNVQEVIDTPEMRELIEKGNFLAITAKTADAAKRAAVDWAREGLIACQDTDLLVAGLGGMFVGLALAEKLDIPMIQAQVVPFTPTRAFPGVLLPPSLGRLGGAVNRLSHDLTRQAMWQGIRGADTLMRRDVLDLPALPLSGPFNSERLRHAPTLYGFSPSVIPKPADWGAAVHVTGFWFLDSDAVWTPDAELVDFLEAGPPPVYVGFGSMSNRNPETTASLVLEALAETRQRAVLLSGWGGLRAVQLPDTVFLADAIPHDWLFPRMAAIVHHGGAGTTAAGLRAGVPSIVVPYFGDQPFWGKRIETLGVGPAPIARKQLTARRLAAAIERAVTDQLMRRRAADLGARIRAEDGVAAAVAIISQHL